MIAAPAVPAVSPLELPARVAADDAKPDYAPIIERKLDYYDFAYQTVEGGSFDLRDYAKGKSVVIVEYLAGWCPNSNRNGHIVERLWTKYRERGLGVVGVAEYSDADELRIHIGRIGIDYPLVVDTRKREQRKDSSHYKYRHAVGDKRKWGTPFYVIIDARDIEQTTPNGPVTRRVYTVSGELVEAEADQFIRDRVAEAQRK
jgi:peroxiredoxin